jgi:alcohol dehydrogenase (cytochrome c)
MTPRKGLFRVFVFSWLILPAVVLVAQTERGGLDPAQLLKPLADSWPSYSGDYTGRRYSALTQITQANIKQLSLAWTARLSGATTATTIIGGEATGDIPIGNPSVKGAVLMVNGVL